MKYNEQTTTDKMAMFNNELVELVNRTELNAQEVCMVLDLMSTNIKNLFRATLTMAPTKTETSASEEKHGDNLEENSN